MLYDSVVDGNLVCPMEFHVFVDGQGVNNDNAFVDVTCDKIQKSSGNDPVTYAVECYDKNNDKMNLRIMYFQKTNKYNSLIDFAATIKNSAHPEKYDALIYAENDNPVFQVFQKKSR
jgi:hypothetical protein